MVRRLNDKRWAMNVAQYGNLHTGNPLEHVLQMRGTQISRYYRAKMFDQALRHTEASKLHVEFDELHYPSKSQIMKKTY